MRHADAIEKIAHLLGTVPDRVLAKQLEIANSTVSYHRNKRGIAPVQFGKLDDHKAQLGTRPDDEIADAAGVSRQAVSAMRRKLGIRRYERETDAP